MDVIAEHTVDVLYPEGKLVRVHLRVGRPFPHAQQGDFACTVSADGLRGWERPTEIFGVGSLHALMLGLRFLYYGLAVELERGAILHWEGGEQVLALDELFVPFKIA
jgi:hypothetical protein